LSPGYAERLTVADDIRHQLQQRLEFIRDYRARHCPDVSTKDYVAGWLDGHEEEIIMLLLEFLPSAEP
jgi:hypothetical protein